MIRLRKLACYNLSIDLFSASRSTFAVYRRGTNKLTKNKVCFDISQQVPQDAEQYHAIYSLAFMC